MKLCSLAIFALLCRVDGGDAAFLFLLYHKIAGSARGCEANHGESLHLRRILNLNLPFGQITNLLRKVRREQAELAHDFSGPPAPAKKKADCFRNLLFSCLKRVKRPKIEVIAKKRSTIYLQFSRYNGYSHHTQLSLYRVHLFRYCSSYQTKADLLRHQR